MESTNRPQSFFWKGDIEDNFVGHICAEVWKDKLYEPYLIGRSNLTILDIGANVGIVSYYFSKFAKTVYSLEPSADHFQSLEAMIAFNKVENIKPIRKALFITNGELDLYHNKNKTMFSLHQAVEDQSRPTEKVGCITLDSLLEEEGIDHVDLMKLDVEGSEYEILGSEGFSKVADKIDMIIGERHAWAGRNEGQLDNSLRENGFSVERVESDADIFVARRNG